ncbi:MAG: hypothetical protein NTV84_09100 [Methanoregula sp.]|nr:hypothetical protein [Methanoregula sp.]
MNQTITIPLNVIQEAVDVSEPKTNFPGIRNHISVAQIAVDECEQKTRLVILNQSGQSGNIGIDSRGFKNPRERFLEVVCGNDISCTNGGNPSVENRGAIISPIKGATA